MAIQKHVGKVRKSNFQAQASVIIIEFIPNVGRIFYSFFQFCPQFFIPKSQICPQRFLIPKSQIYFLSWCPQLGVLRDQEWQGIYRDRDCTLSSIAVVQCHLDGLCRAIHMCWAFEHHDKVFHSHILNVSQLLRC